MWNAIKSDLSEFVTTVKEDTSSALSNLDNGLDAAAENLAQETLLPEEEERERRIQLKETFTAPLQVYDDTPEDEAAALETFLKEFSIEDKTDEISALLEENKELEAVFQSLSSEVEYTDFWQRYFYRCNAERIREAWDEEEAKAAKARKEAVSKTIGSVTGFLGGTVKTLTGAVGESDEPEDAKKEAGFTMTENQAKKAAASLFGGRPPFVMNTAVDESGEDEEEELGWGEDDDDLESDEEDQEKADDTQEIEFKDPAMEQLREELKQALEERDQLHETVAMQTKEIVELKVAVGTPTSASAVEKLKMELFDKEAELAAIRSNMDDSERGSTPSENDAVSAALKAEVGELKNVCAKKDEEIVKSAATFKKAEAELIDLKNELSQERANLDSARSDAEKLEARLATLQDSEGASEARLQEQVQKLETDLASSKQENARLSTKLESTEKKASEQVADLTQQVESSKAAVKSLEDQLLNSQKTVDDLRTKCSVLESDLATAQQRQKDESSDATGKSVDTAGSAVKVEAAVKLDDDGEGWDDDW